MSLNLTKENILFGGDLELTEGITLGDVQLAVLRAHGDKILQIDAETGKELSAGLLLSRSIALAKWLIHNGIQPGDAVSINSENRIEFITIPVALFFVGGVFAPLNPEYTSTELEHVINLSKPTIIFCTKQTLSRTKQLAAKYSYIKKLVLFGQTKINDPDVVMYEDIIKGAKVGDDVDYQPVDFDPKEIVATILCSSGTTGLPKGVMATHANMTACIDISRETLSDLLEEKQLELTSLGLTPFFHSMGFMSLYMQMLGGNKVVVLKKFKTQLFFETIQKYKVTNLVVPPPIILLMMKHPLAGKYDLSSLRDVRSGAAALGTKLEMEMKVKHKLDHISQGYGMTETTFGVLLTRTRSPRLGSVGQIVPGVEAKVIDENGKALGPRQVGEMCFRGPVIMKGYVGNPEATRDTIDEDGWLHTGDVAYFDEDGYFFIVDRIKELIKYKAFQVAPAELEAILYTHPGVADAAVVGLPDEESGELPLAYVVRKPNSKVTEKELQDFVAGKVSRQKQLRGGVRFLSEIPRNPSGKILRRVLRNKAKL